MEFSLNCIQTSFDRWTETQLQELFATNGASCDCIVQDIAYEFCPICIVQFERRSKGITYVNDCDTPRVRELEYLQEDSTYSFGVGSTKNCIFVCLVWDFFVCLYVGITCPLIRSVGATKRNPTKSKISFSFAIGGTARTPFSSPFVVGFIVCSFSV